MPEKAESKQKPIAPGPAVMHMLTLSRHEKMHGLWHGVERWDSTVEWRVIVDTQEYEALNRRLAALRKRQRRKTGKVVNRAS